MTSSAVLARTPARPQPVGPPQPARPAQTVAEQERLRLARELHDGVIQDVLAAGLTIDWCLAEIPADSAVHARLEQAKRLTSVATRQLRSALQTLREGTGSDEEELPDMLRRLQSCPQAGRLEVGVEVAGTPAPLPAGVRRSLHRVASECLFNAAAHAGARRAVIRLAYGPGTITLCVADDGRGKPRTLRKIIRGDVPGTGSGYHFGLADMAARAEEMGGTLEVGRSDLGGIAVEVLIPEPAGRPQRGGTGG